MFRFLSHYSCSQSYFSKCSAITHFISASNLNVFYFFKMFYILKKRLYEMAGALAVLPL